MDIKHVMFTANIVQTGSLDTGLKNLEAIMIRSMGLTELPDISMFPKLKRIDLGGNKISNIHFTGLITPMKDLTFINLDSNPITVYDIKRISTIFPSLEKFCINESKAVSIEMLKREFKQYYPTPLKFIGNPNDDK